MKAKKIIKQIKDLFALAATLSRITRKTQDPSNPADGMSAYFGDNDTPKAMAYPTLVDFRADQFGSPLAAVYGADAIAPAMGGVGIMDSTPPIEYKPQTVTTNPVPTRPIDVVAELGREPRNWDLNGLDEKIALLEAKSALISQHFAKIQVNGLLQCLRNRKQYDTPIDVKAGPLTHREFWSRYDATDQLKIDALLAKYPDLVFKDADIFVPEFPADAINAMTQCKTNCRVLCEADPKFYVIANKSLFRDAYGKRDPILLVQSPFGFFYHILGAWDKEMIYLPEL